MSEHSIPWEAENGYQSVVDGVPGPKLLQEGKGEFRCPDCGNRCTRGPSGTEYGHARDTSSGNAERCPRRPDSVDPDQNAGDDDG
jgi:hypothetical protein